VLVPDGGDLTARQWRLGLCVLRRLAPGGMRHPLSGLGAGSA